MAVSTLLSFIIQIYFLKIHLILNHFRKDNILFAICLSITLIGSLVIIIKKFISSQITQKIPRSNILPKPTNNQDQSFQMESFHSTPRIIQVRPINKNDASNLFLLCQKKGLPGLQLNTSKYNKNIINMSGIFIIGIIYCIGLGVGFSKRFGWIVYPQGILYAFVHCCCFPVLLPTIYFMRNPKHFTSALRDCK